MGGPDHHFFEIAIYRCSVETPTRQQELAREKYMKFFEATRASAPSSYESARSWFDNQHWYPWRYNEAIGWLRLYTLGSQIRGELWMAKGKRHVAGGRRQFFYVGKAFELHAFPSQTDKEILAEVMQELEHFAKEPSRKLRYLDLECFEVAAAAINWRKLVGFERRAD